VQRAGTAVVLGQTTFTVLAACTGTAPFAATVGTSGGGASYTAPSNMYMSCERVFFSLVASSNPIFARLAHAVGCPEWVTDPRFATNPARVENRAALRLELETAFASHEAGALCRELMQRGVPAGPVNAVPDALSHAHVAHRGMTVDDEQYRGVGPPARLGNSRWRRTRRPPRFAEHTDEILAEAGYTQDEVETLRNEDVARREPKRR
jgi:crotonobetainyl-CoA:carnitine CoA-transferase CaiB-like acyl-CoA transferase